MSLSLPHARLLLRLVQGETLPFSALPAKVCEQLLADEVIAYHTQAGSRKTIKMANPTVMGAYLKNRFGINNLTDYVAVMESDASTRAELVQVSGDSKAKRVRSFTGFPVNVLSPMECRLGNTSFMLSPIEGAFTFMHDYQRFAIPPDVTVVGVENPTNFTHIQAQAELFAHIHPIFISRYPQNNDLRHWLMQLPNRYLHFGDFDFAGLNIYQHEIYRHIVNRATFFVPNHIETLFAHYGHSERYHTQTLHPGTAMNMQPEVQRLIALITKHKKGIDQEVLIAHSR